MASSIEIFTRRLYDEWLPDFCDDEKRDSYDISGFKAESIKINDYDASNFIRAMDGGLVKDTGGGRYRCARCGPFTQIFSSGSKLVVPRPLTLWIEPVITIGTVARLGLDYGWRSQFLGMQQKGSAFDFAVYKSESGMNEFVAQAPEYGEQDDIGGELRSLKGVPVRSLKRRLQAQQEKVR